MMLQSWDFVDPRLGNKIKTLETEIASLSKQRVTIQNNQKASSQTKQKLLSYNTKCIEENRRMLSEMKSEMADYLDEQINVLSKKELKQSSKIDIRERILSSKQNAFGQSDLKMKTQKYTAVTLTERLSNTTVKNEESTCDGLKILQNLNSTSNFTHPRSSYEEKKMPDSNLQGKQPKPRKRASVTHCKKRRKVVKVSKCQQQLHSLKGMFTIIQQEKYSLELKSTDDDELISLQTQKISILQRKYRKSIEEKFLLERYYKQEIAETLSDHSELKKIQEENKSLLLERNLLLKQIKFK